MKCPNCNGVPYDEVWTCEVCNGKGIVEPLTNEEWLRTLPADERVKEVLSRGFMTDKRTAEEFVEWLKEKHE